MLTAAELPRNLGPTLLMNLLKALRHSASAKALPTSAEDLSTSAKDSPTKDLSQQLLLATPTSHIWFGTSLNLFPIMILSNFSHLVMFQLIHLR